MKNDHGLIRLLDRDALRSIVPSGSRVLVAVSGGADSVALLRALLELSPLHELEIQAVHVNHGLRPAAGKEQNFVEDLCAELHVPLSVSRLTAVDKPSQTSPEQHWRQLRYAEFIRTMEETKSDYLALGHNADDLVETFIYHLARGTGIDGLVFKFLNNLNGYQVIRPLWHTSRSDIENALTQLSQAWVNDPSNHDTRYSRNLIRHHIVPVLRQINPSVVDAVLNVSADIAQLWGRKAQPDHINAYVQSLPLASLRNQDGPALMRDFVRERNGAIMDRRQTAQVMHMINHQITGVVSLPGKSTLVITQDLAWVFQGAEPIDKDLAIAHTKIFGCLTVDLQSIVVREEIAVSALDSSVWYITNNDLEPLVLRNRLEGDKIGSKTVSKLLMEYRVPWYLRDYILLIVDANDRVVGVLDVEPLQEWIVRRTGKNYELTYTKSPPSA